MRHPYVTHHLRWRVHDGSMVNGIRWVHAPAFFVPQGHCSLQVMYRQHAGVFVDLFVVLVLLANLFTVFKQNMIWDCADLKTMHLNFLLSSHLRVSRSFVFLQYYPPTVNEPSTMAFAQGIASR